MSNEVSMRQSLFRVGPGDRIGLSDPMKPKVNPMRSDPR